MTTPSESGESLRKVVSPCAGVCILHTETKLCLGCYRTIAEISHWQAMSAAEQHGVMAEIAVRRAADRGA
ncbi:MAG: DUF1289 domain-containing protein [Rhodospirillaceae bacterium]|nr:DUF1289 domain-containing protein [Rhodospirillaceae bacterium]MBT3492414.1 DUF1289 domain-containing protein [Rhodospirillaceae bacterium]MBT3781345.1 DUF1289 domain-containing protein [Rhodospirillaceae bacterium]MBT3978734.1 DUF1289 domain-containing protein [Rhodospirillaceae bacterium]MBT4169185.1 DUF1289 domain-containing protein [Rhodospirillaceae bacterium]